MTESTVTSEAIRLIRGQDYSGRPQRWADFGCADGECTLTLAGCLPAGSCVYGIGPAIRDFLVIAHHQVQVRYMQGDFSREKLTLRPLDGILLVGVLSALEEPARLLRRLETYFSGLGKFMVIENGPPDPALGQLFEDLGYRTRFMPAQRSYALLASQ